MLQPTFQAPFRQNLCILHTPLCNLHIRGAKIPVRPNVLIVIAIHGAQSK